MPFLCLEEFPQSGALCGAVTSQAKLPLTFNSIVVDSNKSL